MGLYLLEILAALSRVLNALTGNSHRVSFSARTYVFSSAYKGFWSYIRGFLDYLLGEDHCVNEYLQEKNLFDEEGNGCFYYFVLDEWKDY